MSGTGRRGGSEGPARCIVVALSSSPEFQSVGSTPSPEQTLGADIPPEFEGEDMVGTSSPMGVPLLPHLLRLTERMAPGRQQGLCSQSTNPSYESAQKGKLRRWI